MDHMPCTLIVPAAGDSVRFRKKTAIPKGLIKFYWRRTRATMIEHVVPPLWSGPVVIGCKNKDYKEFRERLPDINWRIVGMEPTSGQAESVTHLIVEVSRYELDYCVVNCDNAFDGHTLESFVQTCRTREANFGALTFKPTSNKERYGYVDGHPQFVAGKEKDPISSHALAGAFYFKNYKTLTGALAEAEQEVKYLSELFVWISPRKISVEIPHSSLHEWGIPETLEADPTVNVDWSNL